MSQLKARHGNSFRGAEIHWVMWANKIASSDGHLHERLIQSRPPNEYLSFFRPPEEVRINRLRSDVGISERVNQGMERELNLLEERIKACKIRVLETAKNEFDTLLAQIEVFRARVEQNGTLLSAMNEATQPAESEFSDEIFERILNEEDRDHRDN